MAPDDGRFSNLELVALFLEQLTAYFDGDRRPWLEGVQETCALDVEVRPSTALHTGTGETYRGRDGVRQWAADMELNWPRFRVCVQELVEVPGSRVVVLGTITAADGGSRGYASHLAAVCTVNAGQIVAIDGYGTHAEVLAAVGAANRVSVPGPPGS